MSKDKYYIDIGSAFTTVYGKFLLLKEPSCIVIKNGYNPKIVSSGNEALMKKHLLGADEQFVYPIWEGAVMHYAGAVLMIKEFLKRLEIVKSAEIIVYFSCGTTAQQRQDLEKVFINAGYKNIILCEKILALKPYIASNGNIVVVDIGNSHTDVGIINEEGVVSAYNINIGGMTATNRIINTIARLYNLNITYKVAEKLKKRIGSLYENDNSRMIVSGRDIITGVAKNVEVHSNDIYEDLVHCYKRIIKVIEGLLVIAPLKCIEGIAQKGIFAIGGGSDIKGLEEYVYRNLSLPFKIIESSLCL